MNRRRIRPRPSTTRRTPPSPLASFNIIQRMPCFVRTAWVYFLLAAATNTQRHALAQDDDALYASYGLVLGPNDNEDCLVSRYDENTDVAWTNASYFGDATPIAFQPGCWNGTYVSITLSSGNLQMTNGSYGLVYTMFSGELYTFDFSIQVSLSELSNFAKVDDIKKPIVSASRLVLCNALELGGCNMLLQGLQNTDALGHSNISVSTEGTKLEQETHNLHLEEGFLVTTWIPQELEPSPHDDQIHTVNLTLTTKLPPNLTAGAFFVIGHTNFLLHTHNSTIGVDVARTMLDQAAVVFPPPVIQTVSRAMVVYTYVISVLFGLFAIFCFAFIVHYRKHPVMTLSQGSFLAALAAACFAQIFFSFTYLPTHSIFCIISGLFEIIPLHLGGAILIARVWRVYSLLGTANVIGRKPAGLEASHGHFRLRFSDKYIEFLTWLARLPLRFSKDYRKSAVRHTLRKKVTAAETACLATMLTLPQVALQVFGAAYYQRQLEVQMDDSGDIGRIVCEAQGRWVTEVGIGLAAIAYVGAVMVAWIARLLPSVFNEKNQVFHAAFVNCLLAFVTIPLVELTNDPNDSPDVNVFLRTIMSVGIGVTDLVVIVLPKIRRVWSGEKVVMSNVLDSRFKSTTPSTTSDESRHDDHSSERICLNEGDPLPAHVEQHVLKLHDVLRTVEEKCCDGRPLTAEEWERLRDFTHLLDSNLELIDITFHQESGEERSPST